MKVVTKVTGSEEVRRTLLRIGAQGAQLALTKTAEDVETYVGEQAAKHNKTGALGRSVTKVKMSPLAWLVGHDTSAPHALFVHWGTKPHTIKPKKADGFTSNVRTHMRAGHPVKAHTRYGKAMLRWPVAGGAAGYRFARVVHHPGTKADLYLVRAAALAPDIFARHLANVISKGA